MDKKKYLTIEESNNYLRSVHAWYEKVRTTKKKFDEKIIPSLLIAGKRHAKPEWLDEFVKHKEQEAIDQSQLLIKQSET